METSLASEINCALEIPLPRSVRIYEARSHIDEYAKENEADDVVMELAKLNYNLVQLQHQEELKIITRWSDLLPQLKNYRSLSNVFSRTSLILTKFIDKKHKHLQHASNQFY